MRRALVLGGAAGAWEDAQQARDLAGGFHAIVATNHAGRDFEGFVDHWVSYHPNLFAKWITERRAKGLPDAGAYWTAEHNGRDLGKTAGVPLQRVESWPGSSGLLAVKVALHLGCERIILAGVPMDPEREHYDRAGAWNDGRNYRAEWLKRIPEMGGRVRSMSGWTAVQLGEPTREWLSA